MTADQLTPVQRAGSEIFFGRHSSWGLGMAVDIQRDEIFHSPGRFGWTSGLGTTAYTEPEDARDMRILVSGSAGHTRQHVPRAHTPP